jgi:transposase-like protein
VATDGWAGYAGLPAKGYDHEPVNLSAAWGDATLRLPAIHLVFGLAKRWLLGTHHGAVGKKHLPAYLDEFVFRFNRRTAKSISHRFARVVEHAVQTGPLTYRALVAAPTPT